jgi:N-acetylmuramoyl-L-alanine amidase
MVKTLKNRSLFQAIFFIVAIFSFWGEGQSASVRRGEIITVRVGEHQHFIRFVLVVSVPVKVRVQHSRKMRQIRLELSRVLNAKPMRKTLSSSHSQKLISGWDFSVKSGKSIVTVNLAHPADIKSIFTLPATRKMHYRVVLDIYNLKDEPNRKPTTTNLHYKMTKCSDQPQSIERSEKRLKVEPTPHRPLWPRHVARSAPVQEKAGLITTQNQQTEADNREKSTEVDNQAKSQDKAFLPPIRSAMNRGEGETKGLAYTPSRPTSTMTQAKVMDTGSTSVPLPAVLPLFKKKEARLAQASHIIQAVSLGQRQQSLDQGKQITDKAGKVERGQKKDSLTNRDEPKEAREEAINDLGLTESEMEEIYGPLKIPDVAQLEKEPLPLPQAPSSARKLIIVIDAGHGGRDTGAISSQGYFEKNITLSFAREIRNVLNASQRYHAILTRTKDEAIPLRERFAIARDVGAHLFISLHVDSNPQKSLQGFSVYTLSAVASDQEAQKLAAIENKADLLTHIDLSNNCPETATILVNLSQRDTMNRSIQFANCLIKSATDLCKLPVHAHRFADFAVLKAPDVPSVLIELGYLSNAEDTARLMNKNYQKKFAQVIVKAIDTFFESIAKDKD